MRNCYKRCTPDGYCVTVWANSQEEADVRAGELLGLGKMIQEEEPPRDPEGTMWFRGVLTVIFILFAYSVVSDERNENQNNQPVMEARK